ncbi:MAG: tetratricopeptide repeat protein [Bacteroidota bacterium]|nr:tetratricopeptide repeat protein [Bacteroidota bacterium]
MLKYLFIVVIVTLLTACNRDEKQLKYVNTLWEEYHKGPKDDINKAAKLDMTMREYVLEHPGDTNNPRFLHGSATLNISPLSQHRKALDLLTSVYTEYPQHRVAPDAMYQAAYLQEQFFGDKVKARELYTKLMETYPEHHLAQDARTSVRLMNPLEMEKFIDSASRANQPPPR